MMNDGNNPFQYEAANNLSDEMIADYYIDDFNYSRFIQSKRNVFLIGERGSGKTMALLYNRWRVQRLVSEKNGNPPSLSMIGVYIPCNTPLTHKLEYQLLDDDFRKSVLSEHYFVLSLAYSIADTLSEIPDVLEGADEALLRSEASFVLGTELPKGGGYFDAIKQCLQRELLMTQRTINRGEWETFYYNTFSFVSAFVPILNMCSNKVPSLKNSHFLLLLDDAHALNSHQTRALNSWIAYRDHSLFSFKVALAKTGRHTKVTSMGGSILEGHDYTTIDLEAPLHNKNTNYYQLARRLISRRLKNISISISPEKFFPMSEMMKRDLDECKQKVREEAALRFDDNPNKAKAISDHVYKYARARYFRSRSPRANRPPYSGFETLVFLSTGVVRNLLEPCYWMYDNAVSIAREDSPKETRRRVTNIPPNVQADVIKHLSERKWQWLEHEIAQDIENCSSEKGLQAYRLLDALANLFRYRLLHHQSEPRALSFTISGRTDGIPNELKQIIDILCKAQLLYIRSGPAKDRGRREPYYVPNKILWPIRGLDPHGQHARVSISASDLLNATKTGQLNMKKIRDVQEGQMELWNE